MTSTPTRRRRISDWVGFIVFSVWACLTLSKMPAAGIFLLPTLLFELFVALSFLIRDEPRAARPSTRARLSAYGGSFLILVFMQVAQMYHPEWFVPRLSSLTPVAVALWLAGSTFTAYSVWHLRHAFSIEPEARRLITSGPYAFARHPVYTGYFVQYVGMWLVFPSVSFAVALVAWSVLMADRMRLEEAVLSAAFPEYGDYRRRVGALATVRSRRAARAEPAVQAR